MKLKENACQLLTACTLFQKHKALLIILMNAYYKKLFLRNIKIVLSPPNFSCLGAWDTAQWNILTKCSQIKNRDVGTIPYTTQLPVFELCSCIVHLCLLSKGIFSLPLLTATRYVFVRTCHCNACKVQTRLLVLVHSM